MVTSLLLAATIRVFGSAGAEAQLTPSTTNVADAVAFVDAATADKRWRVRGKLRAEASDYSPDRGEIGEAVVQFAATDWLAISGGRLIEKWGTGYGWTPTAFIGPSRNPTDPNDRRSTYSGRDMVRADLFLDETSISLYALEGGTVAGRVYRLIRGTDVSIVFHDNDAGVSLSRVFGEALELHAEVARTEHTRIVAGGQYTFSNDTNLVVEVHHGTDGRTDGFVRVARTAGRFDAELIAITDARRGSTLVRAAATYKFRSNLAVYVIASSGLQSATTLGARWYF